MTDHDPIEYALTETFTEREDWDEARHFALEAFAVLRAERDSLREALREITNVSGMEVAKIKTIARAALASSEEGDEA